MNGLFIGMQQASTPKSLFVVCLLLAITVVLFIIDWKRD